MLEFKISMEQRRRCFTYTQHGTATNFLKTFEVFNSMFKINHLAAKAFVTNGELYVVVKVNDKYSVWLLGYGKPKHVDNFSLGVYYATIANIYEYPTNMYNIGQLRSIPDITWNSETVPDFLKLVRLTEVVFG